jgi:hypothetical protein
MLSTKRVGFALGVVIAAGFGCGKKKGSEGDGSGSGSVGSGTAAVVTAPIDAAPAAVAPPPPPPPAPVDATPAAVVPPHEYEAWAALPPPTEPCEGEACSRLAGSQPPGSPERAASFKQGCVTGDGASCASLATSFEDGLGVPEDLKTAVWLHDKACARDVVASCQALGTMLLYGKGRPPTGIEADPERATALLDGACKAQQWSACMVLADYYMTDDQRDRALRLYRVACDNKHQPACTALAKQQ